MKTISLPKLPSQRSPRRRRLLSPGLAAVCLLASAPANAAEYTDPVSGLRLSYEIENSEAKVTKVQNVPDSDIITILESLDGYPVTAIGADAAADHILTSEIKLLEGKSVRVIQRAAFQSCILLREINFPEVVTVEGLAFSDCKGMHTVSLPLAKSVEYQAFADCAKLQKLDLPEATSIGNSAFSQCDLLYEIDLPKVVELGNFAFSGPNKLQTVSLGTVTTLGAGAFNQCGSLHTVDLPLVEAVEAVTFFKCPNLMDVSLPRAESVGKSAFEGCGSLEDIRLPRATSLGESAFAECGGLKHVFLPEAETISNRAFQDCVDLAEIYLGGAPTLGEDVFKEVPPDGLTVYHHAEDGARFASGQWADFPHKVVVARAFLGSPWIELVGGQAVLQYRHTENQTDWSHAVERSTDLADPDGWGGAAPISAPGMASAGGVTTVSNTFLKDASRPVFFRVRAEAEFFSAANSNNQANHP